MENTVKVTTCKNDSTELIGVSTNNSDFGYVRVESSSGLQFGTGGWLNNSTRSTLIKGKISDLTQWVKGNGIKVGSTINGKIVIKESLVPFYEGQQPKRAGADGEILHKDGEPIYRITEFTLDTTMQDTLIQHDNVLAAATRKIVANDIAMK